MNGRSNFIKQEKSNQTKFSLEEKIMSRKSIFLALSLVALVALALAACTPTEVVKTVVVTQEVQVAGTPVIQEVVVTATPEPVAPTEAAPRTLVVCMGQEPDTLYPYGGNMVADVNVQNAYYDGPYETNTFDYQPVIYEKLPNLADGDAVINKVPVAAGDTVVDNDGNPATLTAKTADAPGTMVRPAGCRAADCAVEYDGTNVTEMDQMQATFKLKPGILWSDGTPLTSADFVYAFSLYMDPATPVASRYNGEHTASYVGTDDTTIVWTGLPGFFDASYMIESFGPLPKHIMEQYTAADMVTQFDAQKLWLGWGPYIIDEWTKGQEITGHKNPNYWRASEGLPKFDNIVFRFTGGDANAAIAAVLAGECDIVDQTTAMESQSLLLLQLQAKGQINPTFVTGTTFEHVDFNIQPVETIWNTGAFAGMVAPGSTVGPFGDLRLRQAVAQCIDRQALVDTVMYGQSIVLDTYLPPNHPLFNADVKHYAYDTAAAAALLDEIGWLDDDGDPATPRVAKGVTGVKDGTPLSFAYETTNSSLRQQVTQIVAQNLADCGMQANITLYPASQWFAVGEEAKLAGRRFDLGEFAWSTGVAPPCDLYLSTTIPSADSGWSGQDYGGYANPAYDAACSQQLQSLPGEDAYVTGAKEAQRIFGEDLPVVPLFLRLKLSATRPDMCNFINDPTNNSEMWNVENFDYGPSCNQ
jgi:peptide/nickel transport system substrate-binding protein